MTKSKTKVLFSLALLIIFLFSGIFNSRISKDIITNNNYLEFNEKDQVQIKQSGFWDLTGNPIYIDDLATGVGAHNWTWAETQPWCSGSGNWTHPYIIENVTIDGQGSGNCLSIANSDAYFIIRNCSVYNSGSSYNNAGIELDTVDNGKIINNNCSNNNYNGIYLYSSSNNTLSGNNASNNIYSGIDLSSSNNNRLSGNTVNNNSGGIMLGFSNNNTLSGNTVNNNGFGIYLRDSNNNTLSGNLMNFCGIYFHGSLTNMASHSIDITNLVNSKPVYYCVNEIGLESSNFPNAGQIILINCNNSVISGLNLSNSTIGIQLGYSNNNTISGNTASNNNGDGIHLWESDNNTLSGNKASYNINNGIEISYSKNSTISENTANNNKFGINIERSDNNRISGNTASNNNFFGIYLYNCVNNTLSGNNANNNSCGIYLMESNNNTLSGNTASNSNYYGIFLMESNNNTLSGNIISNNSNGTRLDSNSNNNKIFLNHFINNEINAEDYGINNTWDNGFTGNYWDDYAGVDANDNGIGDTPYIISGTAESQDNFPIWTDGDDIAPVITIIFPLPNSIFDLDAPNYNISIDELNLDTIWYTLDGGITNYTITDLTGTFNQTAWEALSEGSLTIRFYANDTAGNIGFMDVEVIIEFPEDKDDLPIISFGNYYILFTFITITILSFIILEKRKKK